MIEYRDLQSAIEPHRQRIHNHQLPSMLTDTARLRTFMEHHVFAVWDFMSLLKSLQILVTGADVPWVPASNSRVCRIVNELVLEEESDDDGNGGNVSHFELYLSAMQEAGANRFFIEGFVNGLSRDGFSTDSLEDNPFVPQLVRPFLATTFRIAYSGQPAAIASALAFGRETLLPDAFENILCEIGAETDSEQLFRYYLSRHIDLDRHEHSVMARELVEEICGDDVALWETARDAAIASITARCQLWDQLANQLAVAGRFSLLM
ncbi:MAG: DUF3050 domain-containing protein [Planctomycetota bacterium]